MQMGLAKELGMTLAQLLNSMTYEELLLWSAFFANQNEDHEKAMRRSK